MPYSIRKATRRFRRTANNRYFYKKSGYFPNVSKMASDVKTLKSLVNAEKKFWDVVSSGTSLASSATGNVVQLTTIPVGDDEISRDGNSIKLAYLYIEGFVTKNAAATTDTIKVSIIKDNQPNVATFNYNQVFDITALSSAIALRSDNSVDRYKVLTSRLISLDASNVVKHFKMYVPLGFHTKYSSSTTNIPQTNAVCLCFNGNNTTNTSVINYYARLRFIDN